MIATMVKNMPEDDDDHQTTLIVVPAALLQQVGRKTTRVGFISLTKGDTSGKMKLKLKQTGYFWHIYITARISLRLV